MSDNDKNLPVPSGDNVPAKKTGTDIVPRKGTDVKATSTDIAHRASIDPAIGTLDGTGRALVPFQEASGAVGPHVQPEKKQSIDEGPTEAKGRAKWGFLAAAGAATLAAGLYFANQDDGPQPQQYCVTGVDELNLRSEPEVGAPIVGKIPGGIEVTGTGRMIDGYRQMEQNIDGEKKTVYAHYTNLPRPVGGKCPGR